MAYADVDETLAGGLLPGGVKPGERVQDQYVEEKARCKAAGGVWDSKNNVCILPPKEEPKPQPTTKEGEFSAEKGGYTTKEGEFYPTTNPDFRPDVSPDTRTEFNEDGSVTIIAKSGDTQTLTKEEYKTLRGGAGVVTSGVEKARTLTPQAQRQAQLQQAISQLGQVGTLTAAEEAEINFSQAFTAGAAGAVPGIIGGVAIGAMKGGAIAGLPGAVVGAGVGAIGGFFTGVISNIKEQQRGELRAANVELTNARTIMRQLAMAASRDPANADVYIQQFNKVLTRVHQARRQTKAEVTGDLNSWMEDGREQLADFDAFLQPNGIADVYGQKLIVSLETGVPLSLNGEELF